LIAGGRRVGTGEAGQEPGGEALRPIRMRKQQISTIGVAALLALTAACGAGSPQATASGAGAGAGAVAKPSGSGGVVRTDLPLTGVRWKVDSVDVAGTRPAVPAQATIEIAADGRIRLETGCNGYGGHVRVEGRTITVAGQLTRTFIGCSMYLEQYEEAIGDAFKGPLKAELTDHGPQDRLLKLTSRDHPGTTVTLTTRPAVPLTGTRWTVDALTGPRSSAALPEGSEGKAVLVFGKDGGVSGNLGCNRFHAPAVVSGSTVTFGRITATLVNCGAARMELEQGVRKALEGKATFQLSHQALSLTSANGWGLAATTPTGDR
jgi:heat shock protein HslJ